MRSVHGSAGSSAVGLSSAPASSSPAAAEPKPKGPPGVNFVPLPMPIATTLPPPQATEPLLPMPGSEQREALVAELMERRRELTEAGQVLNRVVYDSVAFTPAPDKVPGGALCFESRFESGNMRRAVHVNGNEYDLLLNWDHGTRGHTQWYFFSVSSAKVGETYRFNIVNFCKPQSLCVPPRRPAPPPLPPCFPSPSSVSLCSPPGP